MAEAAPKKKIRLGDLLVEHGLITEDQLMQALAEQKNSGLKLGRLLVDKGYVKEEQVLELVSRQLDIPYINLRTFKYDVDTVRLIPEMLSRRYRCIALQEERTGSLLVGMADATDIFAYDNLTKQLKRTISLAVCKEDDIVEAIDQVYRKRTQISNLAEELQDELSETDIDLAQMAQGEDVANAPVVKLLQSIFEDALQIGASDIHIEPDETVLRIRTRVDGVLQEQVMKEKRIAPALVSRLKLMSGLNISERRIPQDGRFNIRVHNKSVDVRLSTMPIQAGESVVMRLLDQSGDMLNLEQLGMSDHILNRFRSNITRPYGMVLVTGPTGSGKTTTLYSALSELNNAENKIITVEDPVEYRLPRINQVQVNPRIGLTFASVLRAALRQDPDIVLVGEMRDQETAEIGLRAAMTGHMVMSTLHTNDSISTVNRILDMGAQGYLVASALRAVVAQRLVRKICESCKTLYVPIAKDMAIVSNLMNHDYHGATFFHGTGCTHCNNTGYHGRIGVFEFLEMDDQMSDDLRRSDASAFAEHARESDGYSSFAQHALQYALQGVTTVDEVIRVAGSIDDDIQDFEIPEEEVSEDANKTDET